MPVYFSLGAVLVVSMGLVSGGLLALVLMMAARQQVVYGIMLGLSLLLAVFGMITSERISGAGVGFSNSFVLLVLTFALGYALTTLSVLLPRRRKREPTVPGGSGRWTAVICLAPGEPPEYDMRSAASRLELADNTEDVPPILVRPFYMRDIKGKFAAIGRSPYRDHMAELARKVQARLPTDQRVSLAYYSDSPGLADTITRVIEEGTRSLVIVHLRVTNPPDAFAAGDLFEGISLERTRVRATHLAPLWDSELLPQIYVRRVLEAAAMTDAHMEELGLLLAGRGHPDVSDASRTRQQQEEDFLEHVKYALRKAGFDESRIEIGWLRREPSIGRTVEALHGSGCRSIYWMPPSFPADGINTLYDIQTHLEAVAGKHKIKLTPLGAWNADDLAAEEIAARIRATSREITRAV